MNIKGKQKYLKESKKKNAGSQKNIRRKVKINLNESNKKCLKERKKYLNEF